MRGIVCYNEKLKTDLLKIKSSLIKKCTTESQEVTDALAKNLFHLISADFYVSITDLNALSTDDLLSSSRQLLETQKA